MINRKGTIVLTGRDGKEFSKSMQQSSFETMEKRDRFINEAREKIHVTRSKEKVLIQVK
ncbi:MAG TPA: hypothetical protein VHT34_01235 [Clostridia bacterium]|nr:hypothetical protein [Clostridia bacterium]